MKAQKALAECWLGFIPNRWGGAMSKQEPGIEKKKATIQGVQFLVSAQDDYAAARALIRSGYLLQGAHLASLCIEKSLKAVLSVRLVVCRSHLGDGLLKRVKEVVPGLVPKIDDAFVRFLKNAYSFRYLDDRKPGDGLVLVQHRILAALDMLVATLDTGLAMTLEGGGERGQNVDTPYRQAIARKDADVTGDNIVAMGCSLDQYLKRPTKVVDLAITREGFFVDIEYATAVVNLNLPFDVSPAVSDPPPAVGIALSHTPLQPMRVPASP